MFGTALYYPEIDIRDPAWIRSAVLFWDGIKTIVPDAIETPYETADTMRLFDAGLLTPAPLDRMVVEHVGDKVARLLERTDAGPLLQPLEGPTRTAFLHAEKIGSSLRHQLGSAALHGDKLSRRLRNLLSDEPPDDVGFLRVGAKFADFYMAVLAEHMAPGLDASAASSAQDMFAVNLMAMMDDGLEGNSVVRSDGTAALLNVTIKSMQIDPDIPLRKLLAFRNKNRGRLIDLALAFDGLTSALGDCADARELRQKAKRIYKGRVERELDRLKEDLRDEGIHSIWRGFRTTASLSVAGGTALSWATTLATPLLIGAGALLTLTDVAVGRHFAARRLRRNSPYSYLLDVRRKFS